MADPDIFISSCSRRQMARRRASRGMVRGAVRGVARVQVPVAPLQLLVALIFVAAAFGAFVAGHGGV
jgi:phage shock protein PspC (stress-responsive transcriptional regulator)